MLLLDERNSKSKFLILAPKYTQWIKSASRFALLIIFFQLKMHFSYIRRLTYENIVLISKALRHQFIIPDFTSFTKYIDEFYETASKCTEGKNPDYIPQLAKLDPDLFGVAICTVDGQRYHLGDSKESFTLQSCW